MNPIATPHRPISPLSLSLPLRRFPISLSLSPPQNLSVSVRRLPISLSLPQNLSVSVRATSTSNPNNSKKLSLLKTTLISATAASAVFLSRLSIPLSSTFLNPIPDAIAAVQALDDVTTPAGDISIDSDDVAELKGKMEAKIKEGKVEEAIAIVERLIALEPDDVEWPLMRAHLYCYNGNVEMARLGFDELLKKDPTRVEAYHGLIMAASEGDSGEQLKDIEKRVQDAMEICKRENKKDDLRDFKLLIAQMRVIQGDHNEALKVYQDLVKEEPRDFRPYLCQGIIYTLLKKTDEAEKQFEKYRRLVPKGHPYAQYFDDNMNATKFFGQKENERAATRS